MQEVTRDRQFTGIEKAAILMFSLPQDLSSKIFRMLDVDEIKELSSIMIHLGAVKSKYIEDTWIDFINEIASTGSLIGSIETTERLLMNIMNKDEAETIMEDLKGPAGRTLWDKICNVNEDLLANFLKNEYPQTIAVVMSKIKPLNASRILALLPESLSLEVMMRMLNMESVRKDVMMTVENTLYREFMNNLARATKRDTHEIVAEIFNNFDGANEARFLKLLEEKNIESAERVKSLMFTFEDLKKLNGESIQTLLRNVDKSKLVLALKGATEEVKHLFFSNMSERASKLMQDDMIQLGMVRLRDVEEAQTIIVTTAKELAAQNIIFIVSGNDGGDQLIG